MPDYAIASVKLVDGMQFVGESGTGHAFVMDAAPGVGGKNTGMRPMELLLIAIGGCTGMDVASILRKKRQNFTGLTMEVRGKWVDSEKTPKYFEGIEVQYIIRGKDIDEKQVQRAIELSEHKYCSVAANLRGTSKITTTFKIVPE